MFILQLTDRSSIYEAQTFHQEWLLLFEGKCSVINKNSELFALLVFAIRPSGLPKAVVRAEVSFAVFGAWNQASPRLLCEREIHFYLV